MNFLNQLSVKARITSLLSLSAGADDYISKPINPAEIQEKVRKWVRVI